LVLQGFENDWLTKLDFCQFGDFQALPQTSVFSRQPMMTVGGPKAQWLSKNRLILPRITNQPKNKRTNFFERRKTRGGLGPGGKNSPG
jgi:hypothetical protein